VKRRAGPPPSRANLEDMATGRAASPGVRAGWQNFKAQLHIHHTVEDDDLWPRLYRAVNDRPEDVALLTGMEAEHAVLDPMLQEVEATLIGGDQALLSTHIDTLIGALDAHLEHEEKSALPLIQAVLTPADWRTRSAARCAVVRDSRARRSIPLDPRRRDTNGPRSVFSALPTALQMINRLFWEPRYRRMGLWSI
jgi:Hemerythrin HHE cation binding domain